MVDGAGEGFHQGCCVDAGLGGQPQGARRGSGDTQCGDTRGVVLFDAVPGCPCGVGDRVQAEPAAGTETPAVAATTPAPADDSAKPLDVAVWGRLGNNIATPDGGDADAFADAEVDLLLSGKIHKYVGWQADFVATYGPGVDGAKSTASILDLIGKFELHDTFNVWFGRIVLAF